MISLIATDVEDLVEYGPLKPENEHGYTEEHLDALGRDDSIPKEIVIRNGTEMYLNPGRQVC